MKTGGSLLLRLFYPFRYRHQTVVTKETGTIRTTSSSLYKAGKELVVSISVEITRDLSSNESLVLVPVVTDSLENRLELPSIYINSRKQQIIFMTRNGQKGERCPFATTQKTEAGKAYIICNPFLSRSG